MTRCSSMTVGMAVAVMAMAVLSAEGQTPSCASELFPCAGYLNATSRPPNSCCDPIKQAVTKDLQCLCNLYNNPSVLAGLGINVTQALRLPRLCDVQADVTSCRTARAPSGSNPRPPPGTFAGGSTPVPVNANDVGKIASSGIFLIWACMMVF